MKIIEVIKNNDLKQFERLLNLNKNNYEKYEDTILNTIIKNNKPDFLIFLFNNPSLFFINEENIIRTCISENNKDLLKIFLDLCEDDYNKFNHANNVFICLEKDSFKCAKVFLEHPKFDKSSLSLELLRISALKNDNFSFYFILKHLNITKEYNLDNLFKFCIKNQNINFINAIIKKIPDYKPDFSFIYNSFKITNGNNLDKELLFMVENLDLSIHNNNLLKRYINSGQEEDINLILKNKKVQQSLTEKWLYINCKYNHVIEKLKPIILKNKISTF